ncbi:hypothetical protein SAMN05216387_1187 [Nitrosovibrio tenuis]|uniref:Uncharacterized protein n=1 Tax=Nitrosovibrio tenuis TaxID=1233 RepID=A0A1H7RLP7_9PROT|nr:hypothetical protein SAMN05216387_1187 [Nitrosovibrio tenuis]
MLQVIGNARIREDEALNFVERVLFQPGSKKVDLADFDLLSRISHIGVESWFTN